MRIIPVLFPCDLGRTDDGQPAASGLRGAPDLVLDLLEEQGVRFGRPVALSVPAPEAPESPDAAVAFDRLHVEAADALAEAVASINEAGDFPLVLGGDHTALFGHLLGHSRRFPGGFGLAVLADAQLDLEAPAPTAAAAHRVALTAALRRLPAGSALAERMQSCTVDPKQTTVAGVRGPEPAGASRLEAETGIDVWRMERLELDGERAYRSTLERHLAQGPIALSIDARGVDPALMPAVNDPVPDGLDWSFLKRSLEQCLPHVDRVLGLDICEVDPSRDEPGGLAQVRFAEAVAPFLRKISRG